MKNVPPPFLSVACDLPDGVFVSPNAKTASADSVSLDIGSLPVTEAAEVSMYGTGGLPGQSVDRAQACIRTMDQRAEHVSAAAGNVLKGRVAVSELVLSPARDVIALIVQKTRRDARPPLRACLSEVSVTFAGQPDEKHGAHRIEKGTVASQYLWMTQTGAAQALLTAARGRT